MKKMKDFFSIIHLFVGRSRQNKLNNGSSMILFISSSTTHNLIKIKFLLTLDKSDLQ